MILKFRLHFTCLLVLLWFPSVAQKPDTLILTYTVFIRTVNENHPITKQADLLIQAGYAGELSARGNFDPRLYYSIQQKQFDNKNYWTIQNGGIKIPTPFALEISTGIEQSHGAFLNNESITSGAGLIYSQFSMPLLQGLLVDERRNALKQAKLYRDLTYLEQQLLLNELFSKAAKAYWEWVQAYYKTEIQREAVQLAQQRMEAVKQATFLGDLAAIDTLEAGIQYQERSVTLQQQEMDYYSKTLLLSVYLWNETNEPLQLSATTFPPKSEELPRAALSDTILHKIDSLVSWHPALLAYENKSSRLGLDLKLKQDKLKPVLNVKYNPLFEIGNSNASILYGINSYKWGAEFQFPVFLR
ncbi:MAG TPA: hypothetical protein DIW47_00815 [Bacteroidetes bacterium]|nr:hypothetical protein [Bacteroidota bacterium]